MKTDLYTQPHRRLNILTGEYVLVSPHRTQRPWLGAQEVRQPLVNPEYDPGCYLCPGNARAGGVRNPAYTGTFLFDNDFAALLADVPAAAIHTGGLLHAESERGICRVLCFSPRHDLTLAQMPFPGIRAVVDAWEEQYRLLGALPWVNHVQIFENRGAMMGASNPHPHCQIWANERLPNEPAKELMRQNAHREKSGTCLLCDYLTLEIGEAERVIFRNAHFAALVPFWAVWPFEVLVLPLTHRASLCDLTATERDALAETLQKLTRGFDAVFDEFFPYSMGFHQKPTDGGKHDAWHLHAHFYPPLLRSSTVRKFLVGYEMLSQPQRDITPEAAAERLRQCIG